jgi:hypothetical protein
MSDARVRCAASDNAELRSPAIRQGLPQQLATIAARSAADRARGDAAVTAIQESTIAHNGAITSVAFLSASIPITAVTRRPARNAATLFANTIADPSL